MNRIRVLLASDFVLLRAGLHALLQACANVEVIGECAAGPETIERVKETQPDILIVDVSPADRETFSAIKSLWKETSATRIIALSATADSEFVLQLLRAGVLGCLSEHEAMTELVSAVNAVALGEVFLCPSASGALLDKYRKQSQTRKRVALRNNC